MNKKLIAMLVVAVLCVSVCSLALAGCDKDFTVTFDSDGGSAVQACQGEVKTEPIPTKDGMTFVGWFLEGKEERIAFPFTPDKDVTLKAKWEDAQGDTVTFDTDGGTAVASVNGVVQTSPVTTKQGYTFEGWYISGTNNKVSFPFTPQGNVTLKAKWSGLTPSSVVNLISAALTSATTFDQSKSYAGDISVGVAGLAINARVFADPDDASKTKLRLEIVNAGKTVATVYADDENLYVVTDTAKKRFKDVQLPVLLEKANVNLGSVAGTATMAINMVMAMMFPEDRAVVQNGNEYQLSGNFEFIGNLLALLQIVGVNINVPDEILDIIGKGEFTMTVQFDNKDFGKLNLAINGVDGLDVSLNALKVVNTEDSAIAVPSKTDVAFDETYLLNFTLEGKIEMIQKNTDYTKSVLTEYEYEIRVDYNIAEGLRNALRNVNGKLTFEADRLFDTKDSKIFIDIYHKCVPNEGEDICEFCKTREAGSKGSILSVAYSPEDFGSNNLNVALKLKSILPKGILGAGGLIDLGTMGNTLLNTMGDYISINLSPAAFVVNAGLSGDSGDDGNTEEETGEIKFNVINAIFKGLEFVSGITLNDGLQIDMKKLLDFADVFGDQLGTNIGNILTMFFPSVDILNLTAETALYGDTTTAGMNMYHKFMMVDENDGELKNFVNNRGSSWAAVASFDWLTDADGNVKFENNTADYYDDNGHLRTMSAGEFESLFSSPVTTLKYSYTTYDGAKGEFTANIIGVDIDYSIVDRPQTIKIVTGLIDANVLSGLLGVVSSLVPGGIVIPGGVIYMDVTIASVKEVVFGRDPELANGYEEDKTYYYNDMLNPVFKAKLTYGTGETKTVDLYPQDGEKYFTSLYDYKGNPTPEKAKINWFGTFDLVYNAFGEKYVKTVTMADQLVEKVTEVTLDIDQTYLVVCNPKVSYKDAAGADKSISLSAKENDMDIITVIDGMSSELAFKSGFLGQTFTGINVKFSKAGEYMLEVDYGKNYVAKYKIKVNEPAPVLPGYAVANELASGATDTIVGKVTRTNQLGNGINATVKVEVNDGSGTYTALENGVDFEIYVGDEKVDALFIGSFLIKPFEYKIKILKSGTSSVRVTLLATDYGNAEIAPASEDIEVTVA